MLSSCSCMILHDIRLSLELSCTTCRYNVCTHFEQFCCEILAQTGLLWQLCVSASHRPHHVHHPPSHSSHYHGSSLSQLSVHVCACMEGGIIILILIASSQWLIESLYGSGFGAYYMYMAAWSDITIIIFFLSIWCYKDDYMYMYIVVLIIRSKLHVPCMESLN